MQFPANFRVSMKIVQYLTYCSVGFTVSSCFCRWFVSAAAASILRSLLALSPEPFYLWSLVTASLFEENPIKSGVCLLISSPFLISLETIWYPRAVVSFITLSLVASALLTTICQLVFGGVCNGQSGLLVASAIGYRHAFPTRPLAPSLSELIPTRILQARHLPFIILILSISGYILSPSHFSDLPLTLFAFFFAWFYLRYLFFFDFARLRGDHSSEFSFDLLFPKIFRPVICRFVTEPVYLLVSRSVPWLRLRSAEDLHEELYAGRGEDEAAKEMRRVKALRYLEENINRLKGLEV